MNRMLFRLAKTWLGGVMLPLVFSLFSFLIPGDPLIKTDLLLAFHHPSPLYPIHILIVPRDRMASLIDLPTADGIWETALFNAVKELVSRFDLELTGYRLIANGGKYQDVRHLHFHLVSGEAFSDGGKIDR